MLVLPFALFLKMKTGILKLVFDIGIIFLRSNHQKWSRGNDSTTTPFCGNIWIRNINQWTKKPQKGAHFLQFLNFVEIFQFLDYEKRSLRRIDSTKSPQNSTAFHKYNYCCRSWSSGPNFRWNQVRVYNMSWSTQGRFFFDMLHFSRMNYFRFWSPCAFLSIGMDFYCEK